MNIYFNPWQYGLDQITAKVKRKEYVKPAEETERPRNNLGDHPEFRSVLERFK